MSDRQTSTQDPTREAAIPTASATAFSPEDQVARLHDEIAELRAEAAASRRAHEEEMAALRTEFSAEIAAMHAALSLNPLPTHAPLNTDIPLGATSEPQEGVDPTKPANTTTSRRNLLKWGGIGAAATLAAAGGTALTSPTAQAANGDPLLLGGATNTAESATIVLYDGQEAAPVLFDFDISGHNDSVAVVGKAGSGGTGLDLHDAVGVVGTAGNEVRSFGIQGIAGSNANGVYGFAPGALGYGVWGQSDSGFGLVGETLTGIDMVAAGTGRLWLLPTAASGAPTTGSYFKGEQIRDSKGDLYVCIADGNPGTWRKVAAGIPGRSGAINFLSKPIRLVDTRTGAPWNAGSTHTIQVTGVVINGISVPAGALAIVCNVTILSPSASGALSLLPGPGQPTYATFYFATNQKFANGGIATLSSSGQITLVVSMPAGTHTHVVLDANGFIL